MAPVQGLFWLWMWYVILRLLLLARYLLELIHLSLSELPLWTTGTLHSYALFTVYLIWHWVHHWLFHLEEYLRADTYAECFLWIPDIEYSPLGYS